MLKKALSCNVYANTARQNGCSVHPTRVHGPSTRWTCVSNIRVGDWETNLADAVFVVEQEGGDVGRNDGGVEDKDEDKPVPDGFERRVVKNGEMMNVERLHLVFRHHLGAERQYLHRRPAALHVYDSTNSNVRPYSSRRIFDERGEPPTMRIWNRTITDKSQLPPRCPRDALCYPYRVAHKGRRAAW